MQVYHESGNIGNPAYEPHVLGPVEVHGQPPGATVIVSGCIEACTDSCVVNRVVF